jgi:hypothetical protein
VDFTTKTIIEKRGDTKIHDHLWLVYRDVNGRETLTIYDDHPNIGRSVEMSMGDVYSLSNALEGFLRERAKKEFVISAKEN